MKFSVDWLDEAPNAAPEERATVGDLRLWIDQQNVAMHLFGSKSVDHVTIALYPLAEGLAHDWWSLFGSRDQEISLARYRNGYVVPDVRMKFDGAVFEVCARQRVYKNPDVRFWAGATEVMTRRDAEAALGGFIEVVLGRLENNRVFETTAALRWRRVQESRANPEESAFCEAAGALGLDPYNVETEEASLIEVAASVFAGEPLAEFLAGARNADRRRLLEWVEKVDRRPRPAARIPNLAGLVSEAVTYAPPRDFEESWSLGYRRARAIRRAMRPPD